MNVTNQFLNKTNVTCMAVKLYLFLLLLCGEALSAGKPVILVLGYFNNVFLIEDADVDMKVVQSECSTSQLRCLTGQCVPESWICDGENDCPDGSDEIDCASKTTCTPGDFR